MKDKKIRFTKKILTIMMLTVLFFCSPSYQVGESYYVDQVNGSDENAGTKDEPFLTLTKAMSILQPGDTLNIGGGTYFEQMIVPSGTADAPITIKGMKGQEPIITGNTVIDLSWSVHSGNIYVADFDQEVKALYIDNKQQNLARWPNTAVDALNNMNRGTMQSGSNEWYIYNSSLPRNVDLTGARVNMWPGSGYTAYSRIISEYKAGAYLKFDKIVSSTGGDPEGYDPFVPKSGNKYYIVDSLALLDHPGEWYYDKIAKKLYVYTENGDSPANHTVAYQTNKIGISIAKKSYINLKNIKLIGCALDGALAENCVLDAVDVKYADYFINSDAYSSMSNKANNLSGQNNIWKNSIISHCAGNGLALGGNNNTVDNCEIYCVGWSGGYFGCLTIEGTGDTVKNSTLYNSGRFIIYHSGSVQTKILNNEIHTSAMLTEDCGAIYCWGTATNGTEIAYNFIHDNRGVGIYVDNNCSGLNIHHNISVNNGIGIAMNSQFLDSKVVNNTFVGNNQLNSTYCYPADVPSMKTSIIANNLYSGTWSLVTGANAPIMNNNIMTAASTLNADYSLKEGHTAIDKGTIIEGYSDRYLGDAPDAGAIEYGTQPFPYGCDWKQ